MKILMDVLDIKVEKTKQLHFDKFDENFHGLARENFHFVVDSKGFKFFNLRLSCLKDGLETLVGHTNMHF